MHPRWALGRVARRRSCLKEAVWREAVWHEAVWHEAVWHEAAEQSQATVIVVNDDTRSLLLLHKRKFALGSWTTSMLPCTPALQIFLCEFSLSR